MTENYIYMDYAATTWNKPQAVKTAVMEALEHASGNPGRGGHAVSLAAAMLVEDARWAIARLIHAERTENIIFTGSATDALNTAIFGIICNAAASARSFAGLHVVCSSMEHNSVARPLEYIKGLGAKVTELEADVNCGVTPEQVRGALCKNTCLVVINGISNVTGTVNPVGAIGAICREASVPYLVDGSQMVGVMPVDVQEMSVDLLAFPGHKALLGPQGTGVLYIRPGLSLQPLKRGGTGSYSELLVQPDVLPDRFESGTLNVPGIAGLGAGAKFIMREGVAEIGQRESEMAEYLAKELRKMDSIQVYAPDEGYHRGPVLSFQIDGQEPQDIAMILDQEFGIAVRAGLHCAPLMHRTLGTLAQGGTVRLSPGHDTMWGQLNRTLDAIRQIVG